MRVFSTKQHIVNGQETWTWLYFNNQSTNSSTLRPLRCRPCCTTHMYRRLLLLPASVVCSCLIYKLGKLTSPLGDFKQSFRRLPSGNSLNSELKPPLPMPLELQTALPPPPPRLRNPLQETPPLLRNSKMPPVVWYGYFLESPIVCILTRSMGSSKYCTTCKNIQQYYTPKHLISYNYF